jgi:GNAT superfamily N-acetyltransferase
VDPGPERIRIVEYASEYESAAVRLMAGLQDFERAFSPDRTPGKDMARDHFAYLRSLCDERSGQVFLALAGNEVIGFAVVFIEAEDEEDRHLLPRFKRYGWLSDLFVTPGFRGQAIASRLVAAAERHCAAVGVQRLCLSTLASNTIARRFYLKAGFSEHEVIYAKDVPDGFTDPGVAEDEVE